MRGGGGVWWGGGGGEGGVRAKVGVYLGTRNGWRKEEHRILGWREEEETEEEKG